MAMGILAPKSECALSENRASVINLALDMVSTKFHIIIRIIIIIIIVIIIRIIIIIIIIIIIRIIQKQHFNLFIYLYYSTIYYL